MAREKDSNESVQLAHFDDDDVDDDDDYDDRLIITQYTIFISNKTSC